VEDRRGAEQRAHDRASWPIRLGGLRDPEPDLAATTTMEERILMMWPLAVDAWAFAGRALPDYERNATPVSLVPSDRR
jgi:hypothetical protein